MTGTIKSKSDYEAALADLEALIDLDPDDGTPEADRLAVLKILVQEYEAKEFPRSLPDPIRAIQFRMEQQNLTQRDLVPYIGSRSKVSEVLAGKRALTLSMIRALHSGLGIPAGVLLQNQEAADRDAAAIEWRRFPLREMIARGWVRGRLCNVRDRAEEIAQRFFTDLPSCTDVVAVYRTTGHVRSARAMDRYALVAWTARVLIRSEQDPPDTKYSRGAVTLQFMREVAHLSPEDNGPLLAQDFLKRHGISLIVERELPRTYLDGAAIMVPLARPVIGLSLRHDRIDNFWFTLMHELAHISLHVEGDATNFYDDLEIENQGDPREQEADRLAGEALIPESEWARSPASRLRSGQAAEHLAKRLRIHPAIVAGRMRFHFRSYRILSQLVGHGEVRKLFEDAD